MKVLGMALLGMSIIMASCTGDQGEQGPKGDKGDKGDSVTGGKGDKGDPGKDGLACWDLDGNGMADVDTEDLNNDGVVDALDCQGMDGQDGTDGQDGSDKPNMEFYFQNGYNGYTQTQDAQLNADGADNVGVETVAIVENVDDATLERRVVMRFDGIGDIINNAFETDNINCGEAYQVDQAILYLYAGSVIADASVNGVMKIGFYGPEDPIFNEADATWTIAGEATGMWASEGGGSAGFVGPLPGDSYSVALPSLLPSSSMGWIGIPLPRSVVSSWACDDNGQNNKGLRLRLETDAANGSTRIRFRSSEAIELDLRPLLVVQTTEVNPATTKMAPSSKAKDWDNMSYEEKMAPLFRYFAAKEAN